jgi:hemerythrin superfamily protein
LRFLRWQEKELQMAITHSYDELQPEEDRRDQHPRPDVVSMLKADHDVIESLFAQCEEATGDASADTQQLLPHIFQLLLLHARLEEELVYPLARTQLYESDDLLLHEFEETHAEVNELIEQLQGMSQNDSGIMLLLDELIESVRVHVEEEETILFPDLLGLPPAQLEQLAVEVRQRQQELIDIEVGEL